MPATTPIPQPKPIPAFYCVYILRSTIRHSSLYIGSTPNPVRRLCQHNGISKGGAVRTSRDSLRPWEMTAIVTGFPSHIGALQFEWALQNPHLTLHISPSARLTLPSTTQKSRRPKRPRHSLASIISNLHLLLQVPSFAAWPLSLRFFAKDVHSKWVSYTSSSTITSSAISSTIKRELPIHLDFPLDNETPLEAMARQLSALPISYTNLKPVLSKAKDIFDFELEGTCSICAEDLPHDHGVYALCPHLDCTAVSHVTCLARAWLADADPNSDTLLPEKGICASCGHESLWIDLAKEITLRLRGPNEIAKILKEKRKKKDAEDTKSSKGPNAKGKAKKPALAPATAKGVASIVAASTLPSSSDDDSLSDVDIASDIDIDIDMLSNNSSDAEDPQEENETSAVKMRKRIAAVIADSKCDEDDVVMVE